MTISIGAENALDKSLTSTPKYTQENPFIIKIQQTRNGRELFQIGKGHLHKTTANIINGEKWNALLRLETKTRMSTVSTPIEYCSGSLSKCSKAREKQKTFWLKRQK